MTLARRDGSPVVHGERLRLRDLSWRSLAWLARHRRVEVARYLRAVVARALVLPGDRFYEILRDREGEVLAVKRDHVVMRCTSREDRLRETPGHVERIGRDDFGWWEPAA